MHTDEEIQAYEIALEKAREASTAYNKWKHSDEYFAAVSEVLEKECDRLVNQGYDLKVTERWLTGYLTKNQIEEFSVSDEFGYIIKWADRKNADMND